MLHFFKYLYAKNFQRNFIFFSIIYIATMLVIQYKQSYFGEENIKLAKIEKQIQRLTSNVEVGLFVNNFPRFSFEKNSFILDGVVWFKFPIGSESLYTIDKFSFQNGKILSKSDPMVQIQDNDAVVRYHVVVQLSTSLNYKHFPVSDHKLTIILQNKTVSPYELNFISQINNFELSKNLLSGTWKPTQKYIDYGYIKPTARKNGSTFQAEFPSAAFIIDFKNEDLRHFIILYLPLFLLFLLIFTSLLPKVETLSLRLPIVAGVTPILALHSLVIENISPPSSHITKIDQVYFTLVALSLAILLFQAYLGLTLRTTGSKYFGLIETKKENLQKINDIFIIFILTVLIISMSYATFVR